MYGVASSRLDTKSSHTRASSGEPGNILSNLKLRPGGMAVYVKD